MCHADADFVTWVRHRSHGRTCVRCHDAEIRRSEAIMRWSQAPQAPPIGLKLNKSPSLVALINAQLNGASAMIA